MMLPLESTVTPLAQSSYMSPKRLDHKKPRVGEHLAMNMSCPPALVSRPPPKSLAPLNLPTTTILPLPSRATRLTISSPAPPKRLDHWQTPAEEYLAMNMS